MKETEVEIEGNLLKIQICHLIRFSDSFAGVEIFVPVGTKYIQMNYSSEEFVSILRRLQQKEVTEIFLRPVDCTRILLRIQEDMSSHSFYDPNTLAEQKMESVDQAMAMVKNIINQLGVDLDNIRLLKTINARSMTMLSESPSIYSFVKRFKKNCSEEFLRATLTSYLASLVIDKFDWTSAQVKEKAALASILCDMVLDKHDFQDYYLAVKSGDAISDKMRSHPVDVAQKLCARRGLIPQETITIIEQHHELPNGKGYPLGISSNRFNQLSCIFILSQQFIELLFHADFNYEKRFEIITQIKAKYDSKTFEKSMEALISIVA
jgi:response regulator RpfG family c-di-GMP phosphodiesterase